MLTQIDVDSENAFNLPILGVTPKDSLLVRQVQGLDPPDINLWIGDYARDGGIFQGRRVGNRNVVITMDLNPNPALGETIPGLRDMLYKAFIDPLVEADYIKLGLHDDSGLVRYVVGYTEKLETEIFSTDTMAQISIICPDPYIRDNVETTQQIPDYDTNPSSGWTTVPFAYAGTAETGFWVEIRINSATTQLVLTNNSVTDTSTDPNYNRGRMIIDRSFAVGDVVLINTTRGSRSMTVTPSGGSPISIIGNLLPASPWLELHSQANTMRVYGPGGPGDTPAVIRTLKYTQAYWGI